MDRGTAGEGRQVMILVTDNIAYICTWRGWGGNSHRYELTRERARRIGRLLDGEAVVKSAHYGGLVYSWNDWSKQRRL